MPCNSDHMKASTIEIELSRVACLLDELGGRKFTSSDWEGYHSAVYCKGIQAGSAKANKMVSSLCAKLSDMSPKLVQKLSLEMQIWWRDHQAVDKARRKSEAAAAKQEVIREKALAKLTPSEKATLGLTSEKVAKKSK